MATSTSRIGYSTLRVEISASDCYLYRIEYISRSACIAAMGFGPSNKRRVYGTATEGLKNHDASSEKEEWNIP